MLDRVREALFSTLAPELADARVLDLFAGTGSLGLEALSRGAREARFVERDRRTAKLLALNLETLGLGERGRVCAADALDPAAWGDAPRDLVFLDPPYPLVRAPGGLQQVCGLLERVAAGPLVEAGVCVLHVPRGSLVASSLPAGFTGRLREYGSQALWYLRPGPRAPEPAADPAGTGGGG